MYKKGFTLIELLVTISIIAILATIGLVSYSVVTKQGRDSKRKADLRTIQSALEQYHADQLYYPASITFGGDLKYGAKTYLNSIPSDSSTQYCYKPLNSTQICTLASSDCTNTGAAADKCVSYCLYAKLENQSEGTDTCLTVSTYNLKLSPP